MRIFFSKIAFVDGGGGSGLRIIAATLKLRMGKWQAQRSSNSYLKTEDGKMAGAEVEQ